MCGSLGGERIGGGYSFGDCARELDLEYPSEAERDAAHDKAVAMTGIIHKAEKR